METLCSLRTQTLMQVLRQADSRDHADDEHVAMVCSRRRSHGMSGKGGISRKSEPREKEVQEPNKRPPPLRNGTDYNPEYSIENLDPN